MAVTLCRCGSPKRCEKSGCMLCSDVRISTQMTQVRSCYMRRDRSFIDAKSSVACCLQLHRTQPYQISQVHLFIHAVAGIEQAVHWLMQHESDPGIDAPMPGFQPPATAAHAIPQEPADGPMHLRPGGAGVAGILRREEQRAAHADS